MDREKQVTTKQLGSRWELCQYHTNSLPQAFSEDKHSFISDYSLTAGLMRAVFRDDIFFPLANPQTSSVCSIKITAVKELHNRFSLRALWFPVAHRTGIWLICGMRVGCIPWKSRQVRISVIVKLTWCPVLEMQLQGHFDFIRNAIQTFMAWPALSHSLSASEVLFQVIPMPSQGALCFWFGFFFSPYNKRKYVGQI